MRLDQWLWAVRIYKTRTIAAEAIKGGLVKVGGDLAKPAREVKPGDVISARVNQITRTMVVLDSPKSRVGAKLVAQFMEDRTPPEEYQRRREANLLPPGFRPRGSGRPTKRERREIDSFDL
jgi:ribosome-associated heat shock protein Hsp15